MFYYPVNDFGPVMKGMIIGGLGIFHVYLAQFAIGGGLLMSWFQWRSMKRADADGELYTRFIDGLFRVLVLVSFVTGAVTGVAMWFTTIQISPRTIGLMVDQFHWMWAIEWTFFSLEVAAGYAFYRRGPSLDPRSRLTLLLLYSLAAWMSLFWINGILSWQLTPGGWHEDHNVWAGFFNPTFWPSLIFRTLSSMATAALVACLVVNLSPRFDADERRTLVHASFRFLAPMAAMPLLGFWFLAAVHPESRSWALGGSIAMTMFLGIGVGASALIGAYALVVMFKPNITINGATAALLIALGFGATAGAEFVREGIRKPYTVHGTLYSNSISQDEIAELRRVGCTTADPYPVLAGGELPEQVELGAHVFRVQCGVCHTWDGANGLAHLTYGWTDDQLRLNIAQLQRTKAFMPPFAGTAAELEALVQWLRWGHADQPEEWPASANPAVLAQIQRHLDEVGVEPGVEVAESKPLGPKTEPDEG